jgi:hypothetical protein
VFTSLASTQNHLACYGEAVLCAEDQGDGVAWHAIHGQACELSGAVLRGGGVAQDAEGQLAWRGFSKGLQSQAAQEAAGEEGGEITGLSCTVVRVRGVVVCGGGVLKMQ